MGYSWRYVDVVIRFNEIGNNPCYLDQTPTSFFQRKYSRKKIDFMYSNTNMNVDDIFSKSLVNTKSIILMNMLSMIESSFID